MQSRTSALLSAAFLGLALHSAVVHGEGPLPAAGDSVTAVTVRTAIRLDGTLSEPDWRNTAPISDFTQQELEEGAPPTERTEVRILCDADNLYLGVTCFDRDPDRIIHRELTWDGSLESDDMFAVVLDTYRDRRMGFWFGVNANGARGDATFQSDGTNNAQWDGIWEVASRITDTGWTCEIAIPFKTLRFPSTVRQEWGINFKRIIRRQNEEVLWRGWRRDEGLNHLPSAGLLVIPEQVRSSRQLDAIPYILSGAEKQAGGKADNVNRYGFDLRYGISSNTTLDLTAKTDFAQVESDRDVINLTRFSVTYPEKRDFFLESRETFDFTQYTTQLFYSRRIGINDSTLEAIPILGGAKLTQKRGGYRLGVLSVQTDRQGPVPSTNYSALRVKKDFLRLSTVGFMATSVLDADHHDSQLYAADFVLKTDRFLRNKNLVLDGYVGQAVTDGRTRDGFSGRVNLGYPNDLVESFLLYQVIQPNFDPEISYVQRSGIQVYIIHVNLFPRPPLPFVKKLSIQPLDFNDTVGMDGKQLTRIYESRPLGIIFDSGDELDFTIDDFYEYVDRDFTMFAGATVLRGGYNYRYYTVNYRTSGSRPVSGSLLRRWGGFYRGDRESWNSSLTVKSGSHVAFTADLTRNEITAGTGRFTTREYGGRVAVDLSTRLSSSLFVQYNNGTDRMNVNFRLHFMPRTGSDLYLVYNHLFDEADRYRTLQNAGMFKLNYAYRM